MGWREVIHQYLCACVADSQQEYRPTTSRDQFFNDFVTDALKNREWENRVLSDKRIASQQVPAPETYKVIEENPARVIAELEEAKTLELFCITRFLLVKVDDQWKLDDIFWKCTCENGVCFLCEGSGVCTYCKGKGHTRWFFGLAKQKCLQCQGEPTCRICDGKGQCEYCADSPIPGWTSRTNVIPADHGDT